MSIDRYECVYDHDERGNPCAGMQNKNDGQYVEWSEVEALIPEKGSLAWALMQDDWDEVGYAVSIPDGGFTSLNEIIKDPTTEISLMVFDGQMYDDDDWITRTEWDAKVEAEA